MKMYQISFQYFFFPADPFIFKRVRNEKKNLEMSSIEKILRHFKILIWGFFFSGLSQVYSRKISRIFGQAISLIAIIFVGSYNTISIVPNDILSEFDL